MKPYQFLLICLLIPFSVFAQTEIDPIPGWKMENIAGRYKFTPPAGNFEYDVMPPETGPLNNLTDWIKGIATKDLQASGYSAPASPPAVKYIQTILTYTVIVNDSQNVKWGVMYVAYTRPDNAVRYGKVVWQPRNPGNNLNIAARHFAALTKKETGQTQAKNSTGGKNTTRRDTKASVTSNSPTTPVTAPGKGISPADIRGIVLHSETGIGVGGMVIIIYKPYVLLKDGSMYEHPEVSPYDLDVAKSKQQEPEKWGTWKLNGKTLTVNRGSKTGVEAKSSQWSGGWSWANPATPNEKLTASYSSISGGGNTAMGGSSIVVSSKNITFNSKGQFTFESTGGGSYNGPTGGVSAYSTKNTSGTYTLNGFSIELKYNNGTTTRQSFYFYGDDKEVFGIANRAYTISK